MAEAAISGWRTSPGENYPNPCPGEIVVFKDFYWRGYGNPCHPFLHKLCDYYKVSICNLHPNYVLVVSIFITLCESCLGIQPHFNLWRHFFCLKKKGGTRGSKIAGGAYLNLHDGMKAEYLNVPLSSSTRDWYTKWFYVQQEQETFVACDVTQIQEQQENWSVRPSSAEMVQVEELLGMFDRNLLDGPTVALNFICRWVQPYKEQVHLLYEYSESEDPTRESMRNLTCDEVNWWLL
jgi:hypothetical protein